MTMLEAALEYASQGKQVFPAHCVRDGRCSCNKDCSSPGKHPRTANGLNDGTTDEEQIRRWWGMWPQANIAMVTGEVSGVTVVDLDGPDGEASFFNSLQAQLPPTLIHSTPKGKHLLFQYHPDVKQTAGALPGVDIRNDGGYIIAPPSTNGDFRYEIFRQRTPASLEAVPPELAGHAQRSLRNGASPDPIGDADNWVTTLLRNGAPNKQRNNSATKLIGYFHSKGMPRDIIEATMIDFANRCTPPMDLAELQQTIDSVTRYQQRVAEAQITDAPTESRNGEDLIYEWEQHQVSVRLSNMKHTREGLQSRLKVQTTLPGKNPNVLGPINWGLYSSSGRTNILRLLKARISDLDWASIMENTAQLATDTFEEGVPVLTLSEVQPQPPRFALQPLVSEGETTVFFGKGDSGKSFLALAQILTLHMNTSIGPFTPLIPHRGLYLDWETNAETHSYRLQQLLKGQGIVDAVPDIKYMRCYAPLTEHLRQVRQVMTDHSIGYVIVDSAAAACGGEPEKAENAISFFNALRSLNTTATVIAHTVKEKSGGMPFGSIFWHNEPRATFEIMPSQNPIQGEINVGIYNRKSNNTSKAPPIGLRLGFSDDGITLGQIDIQGVPDLATKTDIKDQIFALLKNQQLNVHEIADDLDIKENTTLQTLKRNQDVMFVPLPDTSPTLWARHARYDEVTR